jgi:hypothetical protein
VRVLLIGRKREWGERARDYRGTSDPGRTQMMVDVVLPMTCQLSLVQQQAIVNWLQVM